MPLLRTLTLPRPDDWHLHLRDGAVMAAVAPLTARHFARAIVMPNLVPPIVRGDDAARYRERVLAAVDEAAGFTPLMTLYLTETTSADDVARAAAAGIISAVKLYPAGATTNSDAGVRELDRVSAVLERMAEIGLPLLVHGEVTDPAIDIFDREAVFIERVLAPLRKRMPGLKVVLEHITTADGVDFVMGAGPGLAATVTPHHLIINRNAIFAGGLRPHYYCLPIAKRERHRLRLREAVTSGDARFFLGTDSAPHVDAAKTSACGCAGIFNVVNAMACLAQVFEDEQSLDRLEAFTSRNGPRFYGLPVNGEPMTLERHSAPVAALASVQTEEGPISVFDPGFPVYWSVVES